MCTCVIKTGLHWRSMCRGFTQVRMLKTKSTLASSKKISASSPVKICFHTWNRFSEWFYITLVVEFLFTANVRLTFFSLDFYWAVLTSRCAEALDASPVAKEWGSVLKDTHLDIYLYASRFFGQKNCVLLQLEKLVTACKYGEENDVYHRQLASFVSRRKATCDGTNASLRLPK